MDRLPRLLLCAYLFLSAYSLGGGVVEGFVYYPAWKTIGPEEFSRFHQSLSERLLPAFVLPFLLSVVVNAALLWRPPAGLSRKLVAWSLALNGVIVLVTAGWAIPIQLELSAGLSITAIDRLIALDRPLRLVPGLVVGVLNLLMMERMLIAPRRA